MSNALTTKARVKDRIEVTVTTYDDVLDRIIAGVTSRIETLTNRSYVRATYTDEIHDGSDLHGSSRSILITKNAPIGTVTSVSYNAGTNSNPSWITIPADDYHIDYDAGLLYFDYALPGGKRNVRITYTAGWDGFDGILTAYWVFNTVPTGTVDGANGTFTLAENATDLIVYADGVRILDSVVTHVSGEAEFIIDAAAVPYSTIAADYKAQTGELSGTPALPEELVDICERAVVHLFKRRESEGRDSESFGESSISWSKQVFSDDDLSIIRNYRRSTI